MAFNVVVPIFPGVTQLDFTGPVQLFAFTPDTSVYVVASSLEPIPTDCGFSVCASTTVDDCPNAQLSCVPGGGGVYDVIGDKRMMEFISAQAEAADYVTFVYGHVCSGRFGTSERKARNQSLGFHRRH